MKYSVHNTHTDQSLGILVLLFYAKQKNNLYLNPVKKEIPASTPTMHRKKP